MNDAIKVLGLYGSPRRGGNTDLLLDEALKGAAGQGARAEGIHLCDFRITPCKECLSCFNDGVCIIDDDMRGIYPRLLEADVVILASPIFFYGITAWAKALVDRCQALWARKYVLHDPLLAGAKKRKGSLSPWVGQRGSGCSKGRS
jgi:multimeric flavodoxin WrbA